MWLILPSAFAYQTKQIIKIKELDMENMEKELEKKVITLPEKAARIIVHDNKTLKIANDFLLGIKSLRKEINAAWDPVIEKAHKAHKEALDQKKKYEEPLKKAEGEIKIRIASYMEDQEKKRREAEEKAAEAEKKRMETQVHMEEEARHLESKGNIQEAKEIRNRIPEFRPTSLPDVPTLNNVKTRKIWKWEVVDISKVPIQFLQIDRAKVTAQVNMHREKTNIPGIRVFSETSVAARA
jgi:hypothetical protein